MSTPRSQLAEAAQAVTDLLRASSFGFPVTVSRSWLPVYKPETASSAQIAVIPTGYAAARSTRAQDAVDLTIQVGIMRHLDAGEEAADIDPIMGLAEEVHTILSAGDLPTAPTLKLITAPELRIDQERLKDARMFVVVVSVTYRDEQAVR